MISLDIQFRSILFAIHSFLVYFRSEIQEKLKLDVLSKIDENSEILFSTGKTSSVHAARKRAWDEISHYSADVGFTPTRICGAEWRKTFVNRWRFAFRVSSICSMVFSTDSY